MRRIAAGLPTAAVALALASLAACTIGQPGGASVTSPSAAPPGPMQGPAGAAEPVVVVVTATDFAFSPRRLRVPTGRPVTLRLENHGMLDHDWLVRPVGIHLHALPGHTVSVTANFDRPAVYPAICSYPSHGEYGMAGELEVVAGAEWMPGGAGDPLPAPATPLPSGVGRLPAPTIAPPVDRQDPRVVAFNLTPKEIDAVVDDGVATRLWTFNGTVPGPLVRARVGDTVKLVFSNPITSLESHSVDFHAATGPHGGAMATQVAPGGRAELAFKALTPGVYVYHCGTPRPAHHIAHGMYGLIAIEPPAGWPKVDHELYVMQGELYLAGAPTDGGLRQVAWPEVADERPDRVVMNGAVGALTGERAPRVKAGESVRIFFGVGGPNLASSFHMIGEVFDRVYQDGAPEPRLNASIADVPPGGAARIELTAEVPGIYPLVDHALARVERGARAEIVVTGDPRPDLFSPGPVTPISHLHAPGDHKDHGHGEGLHDHGEAM